MIDRKHLHCLSSNIAKIVMRKFAMPAFITEREDDGLKAVARLKRTFDLIMHIRRHKKVVTALNHPSIRKGLDGKPHLTLKYLHPRYLFRGMETDTRVAIVLHHFDVLQKSLNLSFINTLTGNGLVIWTHEKPQGIHTVAMRYAHPMDNEGEILLEYRFNDTVIYVASFAFAPGLIAGLSDRNVLLITRIQGARQSFEQISLAMKSLRGLSGASVLMAALQGIAGSLNIRTMLGPAAEAQACYLEHLHSTFVGMYDDFFARLNGRRITATLYSIPLPIMEKPLSEVKASNRSKVKMQRDYKRLIMDGTRNVLHDHCLPQAAWKRDYLTTPNLTL